MPARRSRHSGSEAAGGAAWVLHPAREGSGGPAGRRPRRTEAVRLQEAVGLARAIGLSVPAAEVVRVRSARPATLFGPGKVAEFRERLDAVGEERPELVVVDEALTPVQHRNLEQAWRCKVVDRAALILEIFGERARTREGRLQVELAALTYQRSRLVRSWTHLERQRGALGFVGGPGESQLEADRRQIDERITRLRRALAEVVRTRELHRIARRRVPYPVVAMVGYTNAGKSTLFNRLTGACVAAGDRLFATLDPTMRGVRLPSGRTAILSDTVGFVSDLPTDLVAAFRATLEEVVEADLVLHVRDVAHPDCAAQRDDVQAVLGDLGIDPNDRRRVLEVLNKIDLLPESERPHAAVRAGAGEEVVAVSALAGTHIAGLLDVVDRRLGASRGVVDLDLPLSEGAALAWLYRHGEVLTRRDDAVGAHLRVALDAADAQRFRNRFGDYESRLPPERRVSPPAA